MSGPSMPSMTTGRSRSDGAQRGTSGRRSLADIWGDPLCYSGRRVDLLGRSLPAAPGTDPADAICSYLMTRRTRTARELAAKAVVLIDPQNRVGEVVWPADGHTN